MASISVSCPCCSATDFRHSLLCAVCMAVSLPSQAEDGRFYDSTVSYGADIPAINGLSYQNNVTFPTGACYNGWAIGGLSSIDLNRSNGQLVTARDNTRPGLGRGGPPSLRLSRYSRPDSRVTGSDADGERVAVLYLLIVTGRLNGVNPDVWLRYVLSHIQDWPANRIHNLLPWKVPLTASC